MRCMKLYSYKFIKQKYFLEIERITKNGGDDRKITLAVACENDIRK